MPIISVPFKIPSKLIPSPNVEISAETLEEAVKIDFKIANSLELPFRCCELSGSQGMVSGHFTLWEISSPKTNDAWAAHEIWESTKLPQPKTSCSLELHLVGSQVGGLPNHFSFFEKISKGS